MPDNTPLFIDIQELARRIGVPVGELDQMLPTLQESGFPGWNDDFPGMYYWSACKAWLDNRHHSHVAHPTVHKEDRA